MYAHLEYRACTETGPYNQKTLLHAVNSPYIMWKHLFHATKYILRFAGSTVAGAGLCAGPAMRVGPVSMNAGHVPGLDL